MEARLASRQAPSASLASSAWQHRLHSLSDMCHTGLAGPEAVLGKADASAEGRSWSRSRPYAGTVVAVESLCTMSSADDKVGML